MLQFCRRLYPMVVLIRAMVVGCGGGFVADYKCRVLIPQVPHHLSEELSRARTHSCSQDENTKGLLIVAAIGSADALSKIGSG